MCVNYEIAIKTQRIRDAFGVDLPQREWKAEVWPRYEAPIVRRRPDRAGFELEAVSALWGLLPWWAKERKVAWSTVNARSEEVEGKPAFRDPWKRGQRCIVPMEAFYEPHWESGQHVRWRFSRNDGQVLGVAGLWEVWKPKTEGDPILTFTALTVNADQHPLMNRMHKPGDEKRMLVILEHDEFDRWLEAPASDAFTMLNAAGDDVLVGVPKPLPPKTSALKRAALYDDASNAHKE